MSQVIIHIVPGGEVHLEGDALEIDQLLSRHINPLSSSPPSTSLSSTVNQTVPQISLQDLVYKSTPRTEPEWLLIYAHFLGKANFSRQDLLTSYKNTQRYTYNISKNMSHNLKFCVKNGWFTSQDTNTFSLAPQGAAHITEILSR